MLYFAEKISPHMAMSAEGYLICRGVPVARCGTQQYLPEELQIQGEESPQYGINPQADCNSGRPKGLRALPRAVREAGIPPAVRARILAKSPLF